MDFDNIQDFLKHITSKDFSAQLIFYLLTVTNFFTIGYVIHGYLFGFKELTISQAIIVFMISCYANGILIFLLWLLVFGVATLVKIFLHILAFFFGKNRVQIGKLPIDDLKHEAYFGLSLVNIGVIGLLTMFLFYGDNLKPKIDAIFVVYGISIIFVGSSMLLPVFEIAINKIKVKKRPENSALTLPSVGSKDPPKRI